MCVGGIDENNPDETFLKTFPNPFKDEVTISYSLSSDDFIKIEVIDLYGRKIQDLYRGKQLSGEQQIQWNGLDAGGNMVPDGVYFIRISSDKISACSRLIKVN
jgi:flagellar hook assembly protein FlgD